eukprot:220291-Pyramimonas_sp.AAC.1
MADNRRTLGERNFLAALNKLNGIDGPLNSLAKLNKKLLRVHKAKQESSDDDDGPPKKSARKGGRSGRAA